MSTPTGSNSSINVGGNVTGSTFVTGDGNTVNVQQASLPAPTSVDITAELKAIQAILSQIDDPVVKGCAEKLAIEAEKPAPDKNAVTKSLETGLEWAEKANGFADVVEKLKPRVEATVAWIGEHGHKLLPLVGLAL